MDGVERERQRERRQDVLDRSPSSVAYFDSVSEEFWLRSLNQDRRDCP
ncbi:MAG: hypothetical protein WBG38_14640 [Nodosilinea sp.]